MVALARVQSFDFAGCTPEEARAAVREALGSDLRAARKVYAALAHKVWSLLVERRFDSEVRDWHMLVMQVRSRVRSQDAGSADRMAALADLLKESISMAQTSPAKDVARRPNARRIMGALRSGKFVSRRQLLEELGMRSANLSNVLTQLVAHNLVDRRDKGKEAEFRLTQFGEEMLDGGAREVAEPALPLLADEMNQLRELLEATDDHGATLFGAGNLIGGPSADAFIVWKTLPSYVTPRDEIYDLAIGHGTRGWRQVSSWSPSDVDSNHLFRSLRASTGLMAPR